MKEEGPMKTIIDELSKRFSQEPLSGLAGVGGMTILTAYAVIVLSFGYDVTGFDNWLRGSSCSCEVAVAPVAMAGSAAFVSSPAPCCSASSPAPARVHDVASRSSIFWMHLAARTMVRPDAPREYAPDQDQEVNRTSECEQQEMLSTYDVRPPNPTGV